MLFSMTNSILGLDIGSSYIKIVHLKQRKQNWKLVNWAIIETPKGTIIDGRISDKDKLVQVLKDTLRQHNFKERKVVTAVSNIKLITRYITMPPMPESELKQAASWEAKNHIPTYDENMKIDFKVLGKTDSNRTRLVIAGISKQIAESYLDILIDVGLKPIAIDIYPISLQRFFRSSVSDKPCCIIDFGAAHTKLVIIKDGEIYADNIIYVGIRDIQKHIINYFGIREEELESWQANFSIESYRQNQEHRELFQIIMPLIDELTSSINRFLQFFSTQNRGELVNKLILTGGGALWKGLGSFIAREAGISLATEPELATSVVDLTAVNLEKEKLHLLSNAIGLAMRGVVY